MMYSIYQLKDSEVEKKFRNYQRTLALGGVNFYDYECVYTGETESSEVDVILEELYTKFNINCPQDFIGHSLSVSDLVALEDTGTYFCDSIGWKKVN